MLLDMEGNHMMGTSEESPPSTNRAAVGPHMDMEFTFDNYLHRSILAFLVCVIAVVGIAGNALVITAVIMSKKLWTKTNVFVVNLSASDFICCAILPFHVYTTLHKGRGDPFPESLCLFVSMTTFICIGSCITTLVLISINRYFKITKPQKYDGVFRLWVIVLMVIGSWVYPIILICASLLFGTEGKYGYSRKYRVCTRESSKNAISIVNILGNVLLVCPTFLITLFMYARILMHVRQHNMRRLAALLLQFTSRRRNRAEGTIASSAQNTTPVVMEASPPPNGPASSNPSDDSRPQQQSIAQLRTAQSRAKIRKDQMEITKSLFIIVCIHILLLTPFAAVIAIPYSDWIVPWVFTLFLATPATNPFVYGWKHPHFRLVFKALLCGKPSEITQPSCAAKCLVRGQS